MAFEPLPPSNFNSIPQIHSGPVVINELRVGTLEVGKFIESATYVPGSSGFRIGGDGNAEFNNITIRGTFFSGSQGSMAFVATAGFPRLVYAPNQLSNSGFIGMGITEITPGQLQGTFTLEAADHGGSGAGAELTMIAARTAWGGNRLHFFSGGDAVFSVIASGATQITTPTTTGSAANLRVAGAALNTILRSTSSLKYKPDWKYVDPADTVLPDPIKWTDEEGQTRLGFGAEHVWKALPEAYEDENYDLRSIVAVLTAKVKRLEGAA